MVHFPWKRWPKRPLPRRMVNPEKGERPRKIVTLKEWHIVRGDKVQIMMGKDYGKQGIVSDVIRRFNQVYVEGLNTEHKFLPAFQDFKGGYVEDELPLHVRDVKLVDPSTGNATDVIHRYTEDGKKVRVSLESGRIIPKPIAQRRDFKLRSQVKDGEYDTAAEDASRHTFTPSLLLFHEEIMKELNIKPTIPKLALERRDLIAEQLIKEGELAAMQRDEEDKSQKGSAIRSYAQSIVDRVRFWR